MIQFTLKCHEDHRFDSWFQSSDAFDKLLDAGMVSCVICGSRQVEKAVMAPRVRKSGAPDEPKMRHKLAASSHPAEQALAKLRRKVEENSDYVGMNFAREARDIHDGISPERAIYGEAKPEEARKLIEDGVPVAPLPFLPARKTN